MQLRERCGRPLVAYESGGRVTPDKYTRPGQLIRQAREERGLTQGQLAEAVGVYGYQVVCRWENGLAYPGRAADVLEQVLGITLGGPVCGRPEGHRGPCRSEAATVRYHRNDRAAARRDARSAGWPVSRTEAAA